MEHDPMFRPAYLHLYESGELRRRVYSLKARLADCDICPRKCAVNRFDNNLGFCRSGADVEISNYCGHHGEEPALSGKSGSGTIFFSHCNLKCIYCQNHQISQGPNGSSRSMEAKGLAEIMLYLQDRLGCHNINLVSPTQYVPQIVDAVYQAIPMGLRIPIVYNTNAYDSLTTLQMLDGIIDIYLPDIKYALDQAAKTFSEGGDYVACSRAAIREMYRQVGNLVTDMSGVALRGLIVRHLILPNGIAGSIDSLNWLARELSPEITLSIMAQYYPCHDAMHEPSLSRKISEREYRQVADAVRELGMENGWLQEMDSAEHYLPDFHRQGHPFQAP